MEAEGENVKRVSLLKSYKFGSDFLQNKTGMCYTSHIVDKKEGEKWGQRKRHGRCWPRR